MEEGHYTAAEGKTYRRIVDGFIMGNDMYLGKFIDGTDDVIENYEEVDDPDYKQVEAEQQQTDIEPAEQAE